MKNKMIKPFSLAAMALGIMLGISQSSSIQAISMRSDVAESEYINLCSGYDAVVRIDTGVGSGSGTLVSPTKILTAAHVVDDNSDGVLDDPTLSNYFISFGADVATPDYELNNVSNVAINPSWVSSTGSPQYDLAVITLSSAFNSISPIAVTNENPLNQRGLLAGYGLHGTGDNFTNGDDGVRRCAENTIDFVDTEPSDGFTIQVDFDSPNEDTNTFGSTAPLPLEGATASGDSGGPLIVNFSGTDYVVGALNGGYNPFGTASEYGDVSIWAAVNDGTNQSFLASNGVTISPITPIEYDEFVYLPLTINGN